MTRRVSKHGTKYTVGSESGWADWQTVPVMCLYCGERVTLKEMYRCQYEKGTWHVRCDPIRVELVVTLP